MNLRDIKKALRNGAFAWPGGYPLFFIAAGVPLCFSCVGREWRDVVHAHISPGGRHTGWFVEACDVNWEDTDLTCDCCSSRIESAYGMNGGDDQ